MKTSEFCSAPPEYGVTLFELIVVMLLISVLTGTGVLYLRDLEIKSDSAANETAGFFKRVRSKALASTLAYTITPSGSARLRTTFGASCSGTQTEDSRLYLALPAGAYITNTSWSVCYGSRGISDNSVDVVVNDGASSRTVRVALGGGIKVL